MTNNDAPSSAASAGKPPANIRSSKQLAACRFSATTFQGFTGTKPVREFEAVPWGEVAHLMRPLAPTLLADKKDGQFFVPCPLKEAPLVGNTLDAAIKVGQPAIGKMRSKQHVTEAAMLVIDVDGLTENSFEAGLGKMKSDGLTYLAFTTHSHGSEDKPGVRVRLAIPLDRPVDTAAYADAWHGFDQRYWNGQVGKADPSGANLYQQQGTWSCHPGRAEQAKFWENSAGVASVDALIAIGNATLVSRGVQSNTAAKSAKNIWISPRTNHATGSFASNSGSDYPDSDANKVADACQQIRAFRATKGAGQSEPLWFDCQGVVGYCVNGAVTCQEWSSGHSGYDVQKTATKLDYRMKTPPTTCAQFQRSNPAGCQGCTQRCNSPITLGWKGQEEEKFKIVNAVAELDTPVADLAVTGAPATLPNVVATSDTPATKLNDHEVIAKLAALKAMDYDRIRREKAKALGVQVKTLDDMVKAARNENSVEQLPFVEYDSHPDPVSPAALFNELADIILRHIVLDKDQADAAALWVAHTYLTDMIDISPILIINAPEKACAKTLLQTLLGRMSYRPLPASNASLSALFRAVEVWRPTMLIDEADTFFRDNAELHGLVNAGYKRGGYVLRSEASGDSFEPRMFSVFCAKSIAGIALEKHLPDSTMSRGIVLNLRRKLPHETVQRLRHTDSGKFEVIASKLARFADDYAQQVRRARPHLPDDLSDRAQDNWECLLAVAECAGQEWLERATHAALKLSGASEQSTSTGNELLADIQQVFEGRQETKISTADLIEALVNDHEKSWATYNRGKPISPRQLAKQLAGYGISSKTVRLGKFDTPKGFDAAQFADAFARYLGTPEKMPPRSNEAPEPSVAMAEDVSDTTQPIRHESETQPSLPPQDCCGVADASLKKDGSECAPPAFNF